MDAVAALQDFKQRVANYEKAYEPIGDYEEEVDNVQYCKVVIRSLMFINQMINVGKKLVAHNIQGFLAGQAIFFLLNFNLAERQIWITRHGKFLLRVSLMHQGRPQTTFSIGLVEVRSLDVRVLTSSDASLTDRGRKYAKALAKFIDCIPPFGLRANMECRPEARVSQA
jgi:6-phosphofructo-2-kinase